jgi:hypothetical protein
MEFYRQTDAGLRMPLTQNPSLLDPYTSHSGSSRRTTPASDNDRHGRTARKRVPVAVSKKASDNGSNTNLDSVNAVVGGKSNAQGTRVAAAQIVAMLASLCASS